MPPWVWVASLAVVLTVVLTVVVVWLVRPPARPARPARPAYQRDGLPLDAAVVPREVAGVEFGGRPVVLLFDRRLPDRDALADRVAAVPERAVVRLVLIEPRPDCSTLPGLEVVVDPGRRLADAPTTCPRPVDQGSGIGYAVVDSNRRVQHTPSTRST